MRCKQSVIGIILIVVLQLVFSPLVVEAARNGQSHEVIEQLFQLPSQGEYDSNEVDNMINRVLSIHPAFIHDLMKHRVKIRLINGMLTDEPEYKHLKNVTPRGWEHTGLTWDHVPGLGGGYLVIVKIGHSERGTSHGGINLELHETAHSIDYVLLKGISQTKDFKALTKRESSKLFYTEYFKYPEEFFAETFAMYYLSEESRKLLQEKAPETYKFLQNLEQEQARKVGIVDDRNQLNSKKEQQTVNTQRELEENHENEAQHKLEKIKEKAKNSAETLVVINGVFHQFDQAPVIKNGRTLIPLRGIFETIGADVQYQSKNKSIIVKRNNTELQLALDSNIAYVNGKSVIIDLPAETIGGRAMVPLRFITEELGANVKWDKELNVIYIIIK